MLKSIYMNNIVFDKKLIIAVLLLISFFSIQSASAESEDTEGGIGVIEVIDPLRVVFDTKTNTGYIEYVFCYQCKPEKLNLTPKTEAFANDKKVPLAKIKGRLGRYVGLDYEVDTKNVISVSW